MTTAIAKLAERFALGNASEATEILKATAFKGPATDAQMTALCVVAQQYGLNPFTRELYAFPDRNNGIVPVVGVDGWSRIINDNPQFDGMDFKQDEESCTCTIYRKDRTHPIVVTEYMAECKRDVAPWKSHPRRMLRHKAMIQCARLAFGYVGIFDQDEAERIAETPTGSAGQQAVAAAQPEDTPERRALIAKLEGVAANGTEALRVEWSANLSKDQRQQVGAVEFERIKAIAEAANTIEGEAREVTP